MTSNDGNEGLVMANGNDDSSTWQGVKAERKASTRDFAIKVSLPIICPH